jgi:site-specific DNA-cytosine methylase
MDINIREAGFNILAEIEFDEHCCATLRANAAQQHNSTKIIHADIQTIYPQSLIQEFSLNQRPTRPAFWRTALPVILIGLGLTQNISK